MLAKGSNDRKHQRIELMNEVYYEIGQSELPGRWTDISKGGIFVQTMHPLLVGEQVRLRIRLHNESKFYRAIGVVRHSLKWVGMGIEFSHLHPEATEMIQGLTRVTIPPLARS